MKFVKKTARHGISFLKRRWYIVLLLIVVIAAVYIWQSKNKNKEEIPSYKVTRGTLRKTLALAGELDAEERVQLHFQSGGRLSWVGVKEGDQIKKYAGIASLDVRQLQKTLQKYLNSYSKERRDFEQTTDDNDELAIALSKTLRDEAKRTLENAQFDLDNSVLDVELQSIAKEYAYLYSPIAGIVTRVDIPQAGRNVMVSDVFEIINPDTIYISVSADQTEVVDLYEGQKGIITFDAYPDEELEGVINFIGFTPKTGETGTVYEVKMFFTPKSDVQYRLGMTGDVEFILKEVPNVIYIPSQYILEEENKSYVLKQDGSKKEKVIITLGEEYDGDVQILKGLDEGDMVFEME